MQKYCIDIWATCGHVSLVVCETHRYVKHKYAVKVMSDSVQCWMSTYCLHWECQLVLFIVGKVCVLCMLTAPSVSPPGASGTCHLGNVCPFNAADYDLPNRNDCNKDLFVNKYETWIDEWCHDFHKNEACTNMHCGSTLLMKHSPAVCTYFTYIRGNQSHMWWCVLIPHVNWCPASLWHCINHRGVLGTLK